MTPVNYNGFSLDLQANKELSYYEQSKLAILEQPFKTSYDETIFQIPLDEWGSYHEKQRDNLLSNQNIKHLKISDIEKSALATRSLKRSDGKTCQLIVTPSSVSPIEVDAVVNAANETLLGGGGVDGEIHGASGYQLLRECAQLNGCDVGKAVLTKGYYLPAHYVIHTVGPLLKDGTTPDQESLKECYLSCLKICEEKKFHSVVFPCVACGFYGFPIDLAADIVLETVQTYIERHSHSLQTVIFSVPREDEKKAYQKYLTLKNQNLSFQEKIQ